MAKRDRTTLKTYFETGKRPTQQQFADLIDSAINVQEDAINISENNVGIGTTTPASALDVNGAVRASGEIIPSAGEGTNNGIVFPADPGGGIGDGASIKYYAQTGESTVLELNVTNDPDDHIALMPSGNVGIGTTNPQTKLDVQGNISLPHGSGMKVNNDIPNDWILKTVWRDNRDFLDFYVPGGRAEDGIKMSIDQNGNVGIGTTTPASALDVNGAVRASGEIIPSVGEGTNNGIVFPADPGGGGGDGASIKYYAQTGESTVLELSVTNDPDDHIALMPSGNVGIGTINPEAKLDIAGNLAINGMQVINTAGEWVGTAGPGGGAVFSLQGNDAYYTNGNLGIGTTNPETKLEVDGNILISGSDINQMRLNGPNKQMAVSLHGTTPYIGTNSNHGFSLVSDNQYRMTIGADGNIGIGTTTPTSALDVNGAVKASGEIVPSAGEGTNNGIVFPADPGGGIGDGASIKYYAQTGESTVLELSVTNDPDDHIALMPSGNVGIGTSNPTERLHVEDGNISIRRIPPSDADPSLTALSLISRQTGGGDKTWSLFTAAVGGGYGVTPNSFAIWEYPETQSRFQIHTGGNTILTPSGGNVGIGTTTPASALDVNGAVRASGEIIPSAGEGTNNGIVFPADPGGGIGDGASIKYYAQTGESTVLELSVTNDPDDHIALMPSGNVGIGTSNPTERLHVEDGNISIRRIPPSDADPGLTALSLISRQTGGGDKTWSLFTAAVGGGYGVTPNSFAIWEYPETQSRFQIHTGGNTILTPSGGNVGIGTTTPTSALDVNGAVRASGEIVPSAGEGTNNGIVFPADPGGGGGDGASIKYYAQTGESTVLELSVTNDPDDHIALMTSGNVGIGTTSPNAKLEVMGSVHINTNNDAVMTFDNKDSSWQYFEFKKNGVRKTWLGLDGGSNFCIYKEEEGNIILNGGHVGIGTESPDQLLTVNGNASKLVAGDWAGISDKRLKKNIKPFEDSLNLLKKVMPVWYRYNGKAGINDTNENVGIIAQEIQEVFPYMVSSYKAKLNKSDKKETELLTFNGSALRFVIINAIKELDDRLARLELQMAGQ